MARALAFLFFWCGIAAQPASADDEQVRIIREVPFVAAEPGSYRLASELTYEMQSGAAITVAADHVTVDLNDKTIRGTGGAATAAIGILAVDRQNLTIRHGRVSGFYFGIDIRSTDRGAQTSSRHSISDITLDRNWYFGMRVVGARSTVADCRILDTGGSSKPGHTIPHGVRLVGANNILQNCCVYDLRLQRFADGKGEIVGAHFDDARGGVCENNHFIEPAHAADAMFDAEDRRARRFGIWINGGPRNDTFLRVSGNVFRGFTVPVAFAPGSDGVVEHNTFIDADTEPIRGKPASQSADNSTAAGGEQAACPPIAP